MRNSCCAAPCGCVCGYIGISVALKLVAIMSNYQAKYLLGGSDWPRAWREVRTDDRDALLEPAMRMLSHFELVGRTEQLPLFVEAAELLMGADPATAVQVTRRNAADDRGRVPQSVARPFTAEENATILRVNTVDDEIYTGFSAAARPPMAAFESLC